MQAKSGEGDTYSLCVPSAMCLTPEEDYTVDPDSRAAALAEDLEAGEVTEEQLTQLAEWYSQLPEGLRLVSATDGTCTFAKPRFAQDVSCAEDVANCADTLVCAQDIQEKTDEANV